MKSFYVYGCEAKDVPKDSGLQVNSANGCTISFKKRGGIKTAFDLAKKIARWP